jgi:hypothetical protein
VLKFATVAVPVLMAALRDPESSVHRNAAAAIQLKRHGFRHDLARQIK